MKKAILFLGLVGAVAAAWMFVRRVPPISNIPWATMEQIYNPKRKTSIASMDEQWKQYKGKRVRWTGWVVEKSRTDFGNGVIQFSMNPGWKESEVLVTLRKSEGEKFERATMGSEMTFTGTLESWGSEWTAFYLEDGELNPPN